MRKAAVQPLALLLALTMVLLLAVAGAAGGCRAISAISGDQAGGPRDGSGGATGGGAGSGGTGPGGGMESANPPGTGLPLSLPSGRLAFALQENGTSCLCSTDLSGADLQRHFALDLDDLSLRLSPDGSKLLTRRNVLEATSVEQSYWVYDLAAGPVTRLALPAYSVIDEFAWSPDSRFLTAMAATPSEGDKLIHLAADGSVSGYLEVSVPPAAGGLERLAYVPGRNAFVYDANTGALNWSLYLHDLDTGQDTEVAGGVLCQHLTVSPDGSWLAYAVGIMGSRVYVADLAGGEASRLLDTSTAVSDILWSPDGNLLAVFYPRTEEGATMVAVYDLTEGSLRFTSPEIAEWQDIFPPNAVWSPDSSAVYFAGDERGSGAATIYRVDALSGEVTKVFSCGDSQTIVSLNVTP